MHGRWPRKPGPDDLSRLGEKLTPSVDFRGSDVIVSLDKEVDDGPHILIGLTSTFRVAIDDGSPAVRYADGKPLSCPNVAAPQS